MLFQETDGDSFEEKRSLNQELTFEAAKKEFAIKDIAFEESQMRTLKLISKDMLYTNLALLLSDQCTHTIKVAAFTGVNQNEFRDRKEFGGSIFKQMTDVYDYIDFRNQTCARFDKLRRIDTRDYPEVAIREALFNSLVHRDYSFSASTLISIYSNRIEEICPPPVEPEYTDTNEEKVMQYLTKNRTITRSNAQDLLGLSQTPTGKVLRKMTEDGLIVREGGSRNTKYRIK